MPRSKDRGIFFFHRIIAMMNRRALALLLFTAACSRTETPVPQPPVIVISVDTLRADHLPAYGYGGVATPAIDSLRRDGILYSNAWSHCPMTLPSHVSLLTGTLPYEHGVRNNIGYRFEAAKHRTIPSMLRASGYATGAAVSAYVLRGDTGLRESFDFYDDRTSAQENVSAGELWRRGVETIAAAEPWIAQHRHRPFFFFLHLFEPHAPYEPDYDADIATADAALARFLGFLKSSGVYDRALIIFLSDHGEGLGDHGESEHGVFLYREALHVPLIVKLPGAERAGTKVDAPVQLIDIAPTIVRGQSFAGRSLLGELPANRRIYSETLLPRIHFGWSDLRSLAGAREHYIEAPRPELYDYVADPREKTNVIAEQRRLFAEMRREMEQHRSAYTAPAAIDPEEAEKLAALGYIGQARGGESGGELPDPKDAIGDLEAMRQASSLEKRGDLGAAADAFRAIAAKNPRFADAWLRLATLEERAGRRQEAIDAYRRALTAAPALAPEVAVRIGSLYLQTGRLEEAAAHAALAQRTAPGAAHHLLGRVALARRDFETAAREANLAARDPAFQRPAQVLQAIILVEQGRLTEALQLLDRARGPNPIRDLESTRGDILARMDRPADAIAAFESEIRFFPQNRDAYSRLALLQFAAGHRGAAVSVLERMYAASPDRATAQLAAGVAEAVGEDALATRWRRTAR